MVTIGRKSWSQPLTLAPGAAVMTFDGNQYSARYKAARRPDTHQMEVQAPNAVAVGQLAETPVIVNFFAGNDRSSLEMKVGDAGSWQPLEYAPQPDPLYARVTERESGQGASVATHIWEGRLPSDLPLGGHLIQIRALDQYGQEFSGSRIVRVVEEALPSPEAGDEEGAVG